VFGYWRRRSDCQFLLLTISLVVTTITYNTVTYFHNLHSLHANLFSLSVIVFITHFTSSHFEIFPVETVRYLIWIWPHSRRNWTVRAEESRAVAYCRQPVSTVTLGIEPGWDPWPYICSVSRLLFFFSFFRCSFFDKKGWVRLFYNWCSLTTPYSTRGHIEVGAELLAPIVSRITPLHGPHKNRIFLILLQRSVYWTIAQQRSLHGLHRKPLLWLLPSDEQ
jgi:hypothetical protein